MMKDFLRNEDGVTSIEYALIASLMAVVAIGAVTALGDNVSTMWKTVSDALG
jgi:pilus assembly protein Flp/PilA